MSTTSDESIISAFFSGNEQAFSELFGLIEKSETYIEEHINWRAYLSGSRRKEIPEIRA